jgi:hypothetical protein
VEQDQGANARSQRPRARALDAGARGRDPGFRAFARHFVGARHFALGFVLSIQPGAKRLSHQMCGP